MTGRTFLRVFALALALSTLSFAVGIAGDLAAQPADPGTRVVVRIPPPLDLIPARAAPPPAITAPSRRPSRQRAVRIEREVIVPVWYFAGASREWAPPIAAEAAVLPVAGKPLAINVSASKPAGAGGKG